MLPSFAKHCRKRRKLLRLHKQPLASRRSASAAANSSTPKRKRARYKQGARLARRWEQLGRELWRFTARELEVLRNWESGRLREELNLAIWNFGHGRMENAAGNYMDIGGSTGGLTRKILDDWRQPGWQDFQDFFQAE